VNRHLIDALVSAAERKWTGAILARDKKTGLEASVYVYVGGIYSVELDDYQPGFVSRLIAAGHIDAARLASVRPSLDRESADLMVGRIVVDCGWISVDSLAEYHREYLLAALGAVLNCRSLKVRESKNEITSRWCILPTRIEELVAETEIRKIQLDRASEALAGEGHAGSCVLRPMGSAAPVSNGSSELDAFMRATDGVRSVDEIAAMCGFTRAEAVFHASVLTTAGVVVLAAMPEPPMEARVLRVPEEFGVLTVRPGLPTPEPPRRLELAPQPAEQAEVAPPRRAPRRSGAWAETVPLVRPQTPRRDLTTEVIARPPMRPSEP
jgi:hypothetical protein